VPDRDVWAEAAHVSQVEIVAQASPKYEHPYLVSDDVGRINVCNSNAIARLVVIVEILA
jgi:hypothetical protein